MRAHATLTAFSARLPNRAARQRESCRRAGVVCSCGTHILAADVEGMPIMEMLARVEQEVFGPSGRGKGAER